MICFLFTVNQEVLADTNPVRGKQSKRLLWWWFFGGFVCCFFFLKEGNRALLNTAIHMRPHALSGGFNSKFICVD